jgi:hypothetical protein
MDRGRLGRLSLLLVLALLLLAPAAAPADSFERRVDAADDAALLLAVERGTVEVIRSDGGARELAILADVRGFGAADVEFSLVQRGSDWVLRVREPEWVRWLAQGPRVHIRATVPEDLPVRFANPVGRTPRAGELALSRGARPGP